MRDRTSAFDFHGNRLWSVDFRGALAIDESNGNIWICGYRSNSYAHIRRHSYDTNVFDSEGGFVKSLPLGRIIAYDRNTNSVWLAGRQIVHVSSDFQILSSLEMIDHWRPESVLIDEDGDSLRGYVWYKSEWSAVPVL